MLVTESFHGFIETTQDVLLIFEGCRRGLLPRICRRLQERERKMIRSGSVFVFDQRESGRKPLFRVDWLVWLAGPPTDWLTDWLTDGLTDWLMDW
jgi:hypothetical protein